MDGDHSTKERDTIDLRHGNGEIEPEMRKHKIKSASPAD